MQAKIEIEEQWNFYSCLVEDHPGSMAVNMAYINHVPIKGADNVYWLKFEIAEPGEHGMGTGDCVDALTRIEDHVVESLGEAPLYYAGRLRNRGKWEMYFYGPEGLDASIDSAAAKACQEIGLTPYEFGSKPDAEWISYTEFIYPSPERHRWMRDRSVVDVLAEHNDQHAVPRRVDHWIYFASKTERDAMVKVCKSEGFSIENLSDDHELDRPFGLQIYRDDPTELSHINAVTSMLSEIAAKHNGDYDGWETFIVQAGDTEKP